MNHWKGTKTWLRRRGGGRNQPLGVSCAAFGKFSRRWTEGRTDRRRVGVREGKGERRGKIGREGGEASAEPEARRHPAGGPLLPRPRGHPVGGAKAVPEPRGYEALAAPLPVLLCSPVPLPPPVALPAVTASREPGVPLALDARCRERRAPRGRSPRRRGAARWAAGSSRGRRR